MKRRTYNNFLKTMNAITAKGYNWQEAENIARRYWDNLEYYGETVESQLSRLISKEQLEQENALYDRKN